MTVGRHRVSISFVTAFFAVIYLAAKFLPPILTICLLGREQWDRIATDPNAVLTLTQFRLVILLAACAVYGFGKWRNHPFGGAKAQGLYLQWLRTTPWTDRLPLGPTHLDWADWLRLAILAAIGCCDLGLDPAWIAVAFGIPFLLVGVFVLAGSADEESAILAFGLGLLCLLAPDQHRMAGIVGIMYIALYVGLRRVSYLTSTEAGGDLYDFIPLHGRDCGAADPPVPGRAPWAIFIADASGHGPSAAVVIAITQALLHARPPGTISSAALLEHVNDHLCDPPIESSFVTAFLAVYDPASHRLTFASAGHPPPLLITPNHPHLQHLAVSGGYPLGIDASQHFHDQSLTLHPGDTLLLYTDGITESRNPAGNFFGIEGLESALHGPAGTPAQLIARLRQAVAAHERARPAADDQTLVAIGVL